SAVCNFAVQCFYATGRDPVLHSSLFRVITGAMSTIPVQKPSGRYPSPRYEEAAFNPWWVRLPVLFALGAMLFVVSLLGLLFFYQQQYDGKILPGVFVSGTSLTGLTPAEAAPLLESQYTFDQ